MLMPSERNQAIDIMVQHYQSTMHSSHQNVKDILRNGHKGFASYTDLELLRAIQALAKKTQAFEVQNFISTIAADKFVLE